jgi:dihydroorotate dehydrogenase
LTASGALAFDGRGWPWEKPLVWAGAIQPNLFTNIAKTITFLPQPGNNLFYCVRFLPGGVVNAVKMRNKGMNWWHENIGSKVDRQKEALIASVYFESEPQMKAMAAMLNQVDLVGVEVNDSCPNIHFSPCWQCPEAVVRNCREFKKELRHPLLLKISVEDKVERILPKLEGVVEAISINSVRWKKIFPYQKSPLAHVGGGAVSGKITQPVVWPFIARAAQTSSIPVIASAIWDFEDLDLVRALGAKAIGFGSVFMLHPWRPTNFVLRESKK